MSIISIIMTGFELNKPVQVLKNDLVITKIRVPVEQLAQIITALCYDNDIYEVMIYSDFNKEVCENIRKEIYELNKINYEEKNSIQVEVVD